MRLSLSLMILGTLSISCMTAKDKQIYAEVFDKSSETESPVLAEPTQPKKKVKKAEGTPLKVN